MAETETANAKLETLLREDVEALSAEARAARGLMVKKHHVEIHPKEGPAQQLYVEEFGNPKGEPVVVLHGGPGYGTSSFYHRYFDPDKYHVILFDQRNTKRSTPPLANADGTLNAEAMAQNTPKQMTEDIGLLADKLIGEGEKFHLLGGSWGSTLGLYYGAHSVYQYGAWARRHVMPRC